MISVTILTKNSERYLRQVLEALTSFDEVIVLDTGSQDTTLQIARSFPNVRLYESPFIGFGPAHNLATTFAKNDWILSIDSDEIASIDLQKEIRDLVPQPGVVYSVSRHNYYRGKFIRGCGWYPDTVVRLYNRKETTFSNQLVHERILTDGMKVVALQSPLTHFPYKSVDDFLAKMQLYTSLFAEEQRGKRSSSLPKAIGHGAFAFFKSYFLKRGILLGGQGFEISVYNGITAFYKYLKLYIS